MGEQLGVKQRLDERGLVGLQILCVKHPQAVLGKGRQEVSEDALILGLDELVAAQADTSHLLFGRLSRRASGGVSGRDGPL